MLGTSTISNGITYPTGVYASVPGNAVGVYVSAPNGSGVIASGEAGVTGYASSGGNCGACGINTSADGQGVYGQASASGGIGVYGDGSGFGVYSAGNFATTGTKSAVVALPNDRVISLYAVESPENWFEDFGSGELSNGVAAIELDPTFVQTVSLGAGYHVFLTSNGDCYGLYVANKTATGFEVRELAGGTSGVAFDYRIVAKRKGLESVRMEQVSDEHEVAEGIRQFIAQRPSHMPRLVRRKQLEQPPNAGARPQPPKIQAPAIPAPPPALPKLSQAPALPKVVQSSEDNERK